FPKTPRKLPTVLSPEEVRRMIDGTRNLMHRTLLMVLYGTGVRRKELSLLKVADIDSKRMVVHIRQGKGSRDRDIPLRPKLLEALRAPSAPDQQVPQKCPKCSAPMRIIERLTSEQVYNPATIPVPVPIDTS